MENNEILTPAQILEYNEAFARSLVLLADATLHQINGIVDVAIRISQAMVTLGSQPSQPDAEKPENLAADLKKALLEHRQPSPKIAVPEAGAAEMIEAVQAQVFDPGKENLQNILQALGNARFNAVTAQQQLNITSQAALTMGITQLFATAAKISGIEIPG